jgi:metallo-beta-lactamase family protein
MTSDQKKFGSITFYGATGDVTGANFLVQINGLRILVDCGLHQGEQAEAKPEGNFGAFPYDPASVDILFVTHAHTDHIGKIPKLVRAASLYISNCLSYP